ncbi:MAG: hypothetical protein C5B48_07055 [Candidatus Rokuibacteriota bacterium]|nr:MAG: hypothetical protein C5B48_07055 [Candidatus Rokubacteria bacterium]
MPSIRTTAPAALLVALALGLGACGGGVGASTRGSSPSFRGGKIVDPPRAPDFALRDQVGRVVRLSSFHGLRIVAFLYTHCPDVCPIITENLNLALRELGANRRQVQVLGVSVDPRGDTRPAVQHFVRAHRLLPQFRYLTGSVARLRHVWGEYNVAEDPDRKDRAISHSAFEILVDRAGRERLFYDAQVKASDVVHDVRLLLNGQER